jgi:acetoin utilization deacetylase AcuC-like enzyme
MNAANRTGIVLDQRYADHCTGPGHPECPDRVETLYAMLREPDMQGYFQEITPRKAGKKELLAVHSAKYIQCLEDTEGKDCTYLDQDTQTSPFSHEAALLAAGGICRAIDLVQAGQLDNAFALVRPPGHHAERSKAGGFCLYNNVAVGVRYAQNHLGLQRVLVIDWDLHHGNGTQHCFEDDPSVLFFSIHQYPSYPGGGKFRDTGKGSGKGRTVNIPLLAGSGDGEYVTLFEKILRPIALEFDPELILVSAGFDIHYNEPLGGMRVTPQGFAALTRSVLTTAQDCCGGKVVMTLEGGYNLEGLQDSVRAVLRELAGLQVTDTSNIMAGADPRMLVVLLWRIRRIQSRYWRALELALKNDSEPEPSISERLRDRIARIMAYLRS